MRFSKCPRCELNYIFNNDRYCKVCMRDVTGNGAQEYVEMCSICNENPVFQGHDVCYFCLKELDEQKGVANADGASEGEERVDPRTITDMDDVSSMDEIPEISRDMPDSISLESMREDESEDEDDEDEEDM